MFRYKDKQMFDHYDDLCHKALTALIAVAAITNAIAILTTGIDVSEPQLLPYAMAYVAVASVMLVAVAATWAWAASRRRKYYHIDR